MLGLVQRLPRWMVWLGLASVLVVGLSLACSNGQGGPAPATAMPAPTEGPATAIPAPNGGPATSTPATGPTIQITIPEKTELKHPKLGSMLDDLIARVEAGEISAEDAAQEAPVQDGDLVAVTIDLSGNVEGVLSFLEGNGGSRVSVGGDYIEAFVPVLLLGKTAEQPGVLRVRVIVPGESSQGGSQITGKGPEVHGSPSWNQAGYRGQGIKVGVIDTGFLGLAGVMDAEVLKAVRARCYPRSVGRHTTSVTDCGSISDHGTNVADSLMDIAPEVSLYIANPWSNGLLKETVDWMVSEGVSVISHSIGKDIDGPGDGTSPSSISPLKTVDRAVAGGIVWVNAAGNEAKRTWFKRSPSYGKLKYSSTRVIMLTSSDYRSRLDSRDVKVRLWWEDTWGKATSDLALCYEIEHTVKIFNYEIDPTLKMFRNIKCVDDPQSGGPGHNPYEYLLYEDIVKIEDIWVVHRSGREPAWIQLMVVRGGDLEHHTSNGSIGNPADSKNPGMLAVGAAPWNKPNAIEDFSSRGPTPDGRVKPDVVGADCGRTALSVSFCGTSQAAPHVAGLAALVRQGFPSFTPAQVVTYLKGNAEQRVSSPDPNNTWGHGFVVLPQYPSCATGGAVTNPDDNPGLVSDCDALLVAQHAMAGTATLKWASNTPIASWYGVTLGGTPQRVMQLAIYASSLAGSIPAELGSLTYLQRLDLPGNGLTGEIPQALGNLTYLRDLHLSKNKLTGTIPPALGNLTYLRDLSLSNNQLTGCIPAGLRDVAVNDLDELGLPDCAPPEAPTELTATANGGTQIDLSWSAPSDDGGSAITGYRIEVSEDGKTWNTLVANTGSTNTRYSHTGLSAGSIRYYAVKAINAAGAGPWSTATTGTTAPVGSVTPPQAPTGLTATANGETQIDLSWSAPLDDGGSAITGYRIEVSEDGKTWNNLVANTGSTNTRYSHTGLSAGSIRYYAVKAINAAGAGPWSTAATGTTDSGTTPPVDAEPFERNPAQDFDTLKAAGNASPAGIWTDGVTMWVADTVGWIFAYDLATKERDPSKDFDALEAANGKPLGISSDGVTMWVGNPDFHALLAYDLTTKQRVPGKDFNTLKAAGNDKPSGIWSDGVTMWVADSDDDKVYAYDMKTQQPDPGKNFALAAGNVSPTGIWTDGVTMWVADYWESKIYAYDMTTQQPVPGKDFDTLTTAGNITPRGIWSDGVTMWVADYWESKIYAYTMPPSSGTS